MSAAAGREVVNSLIEVKGELNALRLHKKW